MTKRKKFLLIAYLFVLFHTIKDFFQDFLETDFLYFLDANENLMALPQWGRVFDKSTRIPASQMKTTYKNILLQY